MGDQPRDQESWLEFHISPARLSSRPRRVAARPARGQGRAGRATSRLSAAEGSRRPRRHRGSRRHASGAPRSDRSGSVPPSGFRPDLRQRRLARAPCCPGPAPAQSQTGASARAPRGLSGRGRTAAGVRAALPRPRIRARQPHRMTAPAEREPVQVDSEFARRSQNGIVRDRGCPLRTAWAPGEPGSSPPDAVRADSQLS